MKKLVIALSAIAAFTAPALAADLPSKAPMRAAPIAMGPSWTGCYIGGGFGYGMYNAESRVYDTATGRYVYTDGTTGGKGWIGQAQLGCDYQFGGNWVIGAFGDYSFSDVSSGDKTFSGFGVGNLKQDRTWAVGGRVGYLVSPSFLSYFSGGWTQTHFNQVNYTEAYPNACFGVCNVSLPGSTYNGWFLGSGFEYSLGFLPGLNLKTEYRFSTFDRKLTPNVVTSTGGLFGTSETVRPFTQSIMTSLVYRFNWGGPVVAKY